MATERGDNGCGDTTCPAVFLSGISVEKSSEVANGVKLFPHLIGDTACVGLSVYEQDVVSFFSPAARLKSVDREEEEVKLPRKAAEIMSEPLVLPQTLPGLLFNTEPSAPAGESSRGKA